MNINTISLFLCLRFSFTLTHVNAQHTSRDPCLFFHGDSCFHANLTAAFIFSLSHRHLLPNHALVYSQLYTHRNTFFFNHTSCVLAKMDWNTILILKPKTLLIEPLTWQGLIFKNQFDWSPSYCWKALLHSLAELLQVLFYLPSHALTFNTAAKTMKWCRETGNSWCWGYAKGIIGPLGQ